MKDGIYFVSGDGRGPHVPMTILSATHSCMRSVSYTHLRAHETSLHLVCRLLLEKKIDIEQTFVELK